MRGWDWWRENVEVYRTITHVNGELGIQTHAPANECPWPGTCCPLPLPRARVRRRRKKMTTKAEGYKALTWFVGAIIVRIGWECGGWLWMKLVG